MFLRILSAKIAILFMLIFKFFPIDIAFVCDNNYAYMLATSIVSLLDNKDESDTINIYVLHPDFTKKTIERLNSICNKKCSINYIKLDLSKLKNVRKDFHYMTYTKCLIPGLLPKLDKVLYLDVDTIVLKSLKELWETELGDNYVAAVQEFGNYELFDEKNIKYYRKKYKNKIKFMINAGVMLLNLKKLRENDFEKKFIHEALHEKHYLSDQPIFFFLFWDHIKYLPPKWNAQSLGLFYKIDMKNIIYTKQEIYNMKNNPCIVHFSTKTHLNPLHFFHNHFLAYLYKTPWKYKMDSFFKKTKNEYLVNFINEMSILDFLYIQILILLSKLGFL